ncbi:MAG: TIGR02300 family protein, partial [Pseudomonadota bacterium]|nr:TIGR02300 family protein [Pseudomonadota bacterium]
DAPEVISLEEADEDAKDDDIPEIEDEEDVDLGDDDADTFLEEEEEEDDDVADIIGVGEDEDEA